MVSQNRCAALESRSNGYNLPEKSEFEHRLRAVELYVELLITRFKTGDYWPQGIADVATFLATMPFPTGEYYSMSQHLENAEDYGRQNEFGAATFELRILRGHLQKI
jgi:hypothetical protein